MKAIRHRFAATAIHTRVTAAYHSCSLSDLAHHRTVRDLSNDSTTSH